LLKHKKVNKKNVNKNAIIKGTTIIFIKIKIRNNLKLIKNQGGNK